MRLPPVLTVCLACLAGLALPGRAAARTEAFTVAVIDNDDRDGGIRYRNVVLQAGDKVSARPGGQQFIPLPRLDKARHTRCLAALHRDGIRTPEAECFPLDTTK